MEASLGRTALGAVDETQIPLPSQCSPDLDLHRREAFTALFTGDFVFLIFCRETILDKQNESHPQFTLLNSQTW